MKQYFPVLNSNGIKFLKTTLTVGFDQVYSHILKTPFVFNIEDVLTNPLNVLYHNFYKNSQTSPYNIDANTINILFNDPTTKFNERHVFFDFFSVIDEALKQKDEKFAAYIKKTYEKLLDLLFFDERIDFSTFIGQLSRQVICARSKEVKEEIQKYVDGQMAEKVNINNRIREMAKKLGMVNNVETLARIVKRCKNDNFSKTTVITPDNRALKPFVKKLEEDSEYQDLKVGKDSRDFKTLTDDVIRKIYNEEATADVVPKAVISKMVETVKKNVDYSSQTDDFVNYLSIVDIRYDPNEPPSLIISEEIEDSVDAQEIIQEDETVDVSDLKANRNKISIGKKDVVNAWKVMGQLLNAPYQCLIESAPEPVPNHFIYSGKETFGDDLKTLSNKGLFKVFKHIDKFSRRWYEVKKEYATQNFYLYISDNGVVQHFKDAGRHKNFTGGIADIYPAQKVVMFYMYFLLYPGLSKNHKTIHLINDFESLLAVYSLYVSLFNSFCSTIMETSWNTAISNEYVYNFYPIQCQETFEFMNVYYETRAFGDEILKAPDGVIDTCTDILPGQSLDRLNSSRLNKGDSINVQHKSSDGTTHTDEISKGVGYPEVYPTSPPETVNTSDDEIQNVADETVNNREFLNIYESLEKERINTESIFNYFKKTPTFEALKGPLSSEYISGQRGKIGEFYDKIDEDITPKYSPLEKKYRFLPPASIPSEFGKLKRQIKKFEAVCTKFNKLLNDFCDELNNPDIENKLILYGLSCGISAKQSDNNPVLDIQNDLNPILYENCSRAYEDGKNYKNLTLDAYVYYGQLIVKLRYVNVLHNLIEITKVIDTIFGSNCSLNNFSNLVKYYETRGVNQITIPVTVKNIGEGAFAYCTSLTQIMIPNSVQTIGEGAFAYCTSLTQIMIPNSVGFIGACSFVCCSSLEVVEFAPDIDLKTLPSDCFVECSSLPRIDIPLSVHNICSGCFYKCTLLKTITCAHYAKFNHDAFDFCPRDLKITRVNVHPTNQPIVTT